MRTLLLIYFALVILALSACQKSNQDATVPPMSTDCFNNPSLCNSQIYQNSPGFTPYNYNQNQFGYNYNYNYGYQYGHPYGSQPLNPNYLCNCPAGTVPTYNGYAGLGCVQSTYVYGYATATYGYTTNNNQWTNIPQVSNIVGYSNRGCYNGVIQSCLVTDSSTCQTGYSCRITSASSALGVCVSNSGNSQYGQVLR